MLIVNKVDANSEKDEEVYKNYLDELDFGTSDLKEKIKM